MQHWALSLLLFSSSVAFGCTCAPPPLDQTKIAPRDPGDIVFRGRVVQVQVKGLPEKLAVGEHISSTRTEVTFSDVRRVQGSEHSKFIVETGKGGGDCGYEFVEGNTYLVHASKDESGVLSTSICSGNSNLGDVDPGSVDDPNSSRNSKVCGKVLLPQTAQSRTADVLLFQPRPEPLPFVVAGEAATQTDGSFCVENVPPGKYIVRAQVGSPEEYDPKDILYFGYYPEGDRLSQAVPVVAGSRPDPSFIQFRILEQPFYHIAGRVVGLCHECPLTDGTALVFFNSDRSVGTSDPVELATDGSFHTDILPGSYSVFAVRANQEAGEVVIVSSPTKLEVDSNISELTVTVEDTK